MAGRGRGRGRNVSFNVEALGFGRGEALPGPILQPPPLFPPNDFKPVPLLQGEEHDYMLALKQEFRGTCQKSPFYLQPSEKRKDIDRYSDKYQFGQDNQNTCTTDWRRFPAELKPRSAKKRKKGTIKPNIPKKQTVTKEDIDKTLESLEKKEEKVEEGNEDEDEDEEKKDEEEEGQIEDDELYEEDEIEEGTDYIMSYFDNGEGYGDDDDDVDEGPVY